jgi:hypothetical protein
MVHTCNPSPWEAEAGCSVHIHTLGQWDRLLRDWKKMSADIMEHIRAIETCEQAESSCVQMDGHTTMATWVKGFQVGSIEVLMSFVCFFSLARIPRKSYLWHMCRKVFSLDNICMPSSECLWGISVLSDDAYQMLFYVCEFNQIDKAFPYTLHGYYPSSV